MPTRGKQKGNNGELKIAKFLTELYESKFMRVPNSGAAVGGLNAHRKALMDREQLSLFKSDIIPPSHMQGLVLESKFYKSFPFEKLSGNERIPQLEGWIKQTLDSVDEGDVWFLIVRINHKGTWACFDASLLPHLNIQNHTRYFDRVWCEFESLFTSNKLEIQQLCATDRTSQ